MKVKDILLQKGPEVFSIGEEKTLQEALKVLVNNNIGVLIVLDFNAKISGIISERDIIRSAHQNPDLFLSVLVKDVMTKDIIIVEPDDTLEYVESIITEERIRHLPVVQNQVLIGMVSIGDLIKVQLSSTIADNKYLHDYISGNVR